ncbi:MAG: SRPBCC family protein [Williamsia sp.]|nr:SRPBCC family protein [Williamsia sp.]
MAVHSLKTVQLIPVSVSQAWTFFSDPANLADLTPAYLSFHIISHHQGNTMYPGQIIEYTIKPLLGIRVYWMTEITHVSHEKFFVDEQRYGPYSFWHHQHRFKPVDGGVEMTDIVHYKIPLGFLGGIAHGLLVRRRLEQIFSYRFEKIESYFGKWPAGQSKNIQFF